MAAAVEEPRPRSFPHDSAALHPEGGDGEQLPFDQHQLIVCNAYTSRQPLDILQVRTRESLTAGKPLAYKQCAEFFLSLEEGEELDFKSGGQDVSTFSAKGLPNSSASLLLVPHRRGPREIGINFQSHAFTKVQTPQIAVMDVYVGNKSEAGEVQIIEDLPVAGKRLRNRVEERIKFGSVVAVNPGEYEVLLAGGGAKASRPDGSSSGSVSLHAAGETKFVVLRVGGESEAEGDHYPQELLGFPNAACSISTCFSFVSILIFVVHLLSDGLS